MSKTSKVLDKAIRTVDGVIRGNSLSAFVKNLEAKGYKLDSADKQALEKRGGYATLYKGGKSYYADVTKYSNGDYELQEYNIRQA